MGVNQFTALTDKEFVANYLGTIISDDVSEAKIDQ